MFAFNYNVSLPKLADEQWGGEQRFGWVLAVTSIGSLTGSLLTARMRRVPMNWLLVSMVMLGVGAIGMAWAPNSGSAFAWSIPLGVGGAGFITAANAISQQESPSDMRSRLMALQAVAFLGTTPIGSPDHRVDRRRGQRSVVAGLRGCDQPGVCRSGAWAYLAVTAAEGISTRRSAVEMVEVGRTSAARDSTACLRPSNSSNRSSPT